MSDHEAEPVRYFTLSMGGKESVGWFQSMSGLGAEFAVVEQTATDSNGKPYKFKTAGAIKYSNVVLKRVADSKTDLWKWVEEVFDAGPSGKRVDATIEAKDQAGGTVATYSLTNCWPCQWKAADLDASKDEAAFEELHLAYEGFKRV